MMKMRLKEVNRGSSFIRLTAMATLFLATGAAACAQAPSAAPPDVVSSSAGNISLE
jgi:hypothetical protein